MPRTLTAVALTLICAAYALAQVAEPQQPPAWEDVREEVEERLLLRKSEEVIGLCTRVLAGEPDCAQALFARACAADGHWRFQAAMADYSAAIEADPSLTEAYLKRALLHERYDDEEAARADTQRALELATERVARDPEDAEAYLLLGMALVRRDGSAVAGEDDWERALELAPSDYRAHLYLARIAEYRENTTEALALYDRALELEPRSMRVRELRAMLLRDMGSLEEARNEYEEMLTLSSDDPVTHWQLGALVIRQGDRDGAMAEYSRALEIDPDFCPALSARAVSRSAAGDYEGAVEDLTHEIELLTEMGLGTEDEWRNLAFTWQQAGEPGKALEASEESVAADPDSPAPRIGHARLMMMQGDCPAAWQSLHEAEDRMENAPDFRARYLQDAIDALRTELGQHMPEPEREGGG